MKRCHKFGLLCRTNWIHIRHGHPSMIFLIKLMDTWASLSAHYLNILSNFESNATRVINQMWWNNPVTTGAQKYAPTNPPKKRQSHLQFLSFSPFFFEICHFSARNLGEQWENKTAAPGHLGPCSRAPGPLRWSPRSPASWSSALPGAICIDG